MDKKKIKNFQKSLDKYIGFMLSYFLRREALV